MNEIREYLKKFNACEEGYDWAVESCTTMQEVWDTCKPEWLIWLATDTDCTTDREKHEFGLAAAQQVEHLMTDQRSKDALKVKRRWLDGAATDEEFETAREAAWAAARVAAWAARVAAREAAGAARAALEVAGAARAAAGAAAWATARAVGEVAQAARSAGAAARDTQAKWIRDNLKPNFTRGAK